MIHHLVKVYVWLEMVISLLKYLKFSYFQYDYSRVRSMSILTYLDNRKLPVQFRLSNIKYVLVLK